MGGIWQSGGNLRAALRRALATLGVVATLAATVPAATPAGPALDGTLGSAQAADVNRNAVAPKAPRQQDIAAPAPSRDRLGPAPQPATVAHDRVAQPIAAAPRPIFVTGATSLVAAEATIAAQPRAPPFSRT